MCYSLSVKEMNIIKNFKESHENVCYYCGKTIPENEKITADHKTPVSRGGKTIEENLVICCHDCNQDKSDMTEDEYKEYLHKKEEITKGCENYISMVKIYDETINEYDLTTKKLNSKVKEKTSIEKIILRETCNAAEGYNLYRDFKNTLIEIEELTDKRLELMPLNDHAIQNKKNLIKAYDKVIKDKIGKLRSEMNIGRLGKTLKEVV